MTAALTHANLLTLVGADVKLRRVAGTNGGEFAGSCPFCSGRDRLRVWPTPSSGTPRWWCRQCNQKGDAIDYLRQRDGLSFAEALDRLGGTPIPSPYSHKSQNARPSPRPDDVPPAWGEAAERVITECAIRLWTDEGARALAWLRARGLKEDTLRAWSIGYSPADGEYHGLRLDRGIVIPGRGVDGRLWYIKVRRPTGDPKYRAATGSKAALFGRLTRHSALLLCEGEFDALLTHQEAGHLLDVATFGSAQAKPAARWLPYLLPYRMLLVVYDADDAGIAGAEGWTWTQRARRLHLPLAPSQGKDLTDAWKSGINLAAWFAEQLPQPQPASLTAPTPLASDDGLPAQGDVYEQARQLFNRIGDAGPEVWDLLNGPRGAPLLEQFGPDMAAALDADDATTLELAWNSFRQEFGRVWQQRYQQKGGAA